jgi:glycosyltransferase involved in cell wall biosynthesis
MNQKYVKFSFVIPLLDEEHTLEKLFLGIKQAINKIGNENFEVIFIDDGSTDSSWSVIQTLKENYANNVIAIKFRKNFGKSMALYAGFLKAQGDLVFTMDADLQDNPVEIPNFINKLDEGYDVVVGYKKNRHDPLSKTLPSKVFNKVTAIVSGIHLHDFNCGFKLYKKEVIKNIEIYGELHRYVPILASYYGFKIAEIVVKHNERQYGVSKYGYQRYIRGLLDLSTVIITTKYLQRPNHFFGGLGILFGLIGFLSLSYLITIWFNGYSIGHRPLLLFGILSVMLSVQMLSLGLISELINKNSKNNRIEKIVEQF